MFVGALKIAAAWFPASYFATLSAATAATGVLGGLVATAPLAWLATGFGWRGALVVVGVVTLRRRPLVSRAGARPARPARRGGRARAELAGRPVRAGPRPAQPGHLAAVRRLLLPLLGHEQPLLLGGALPSRRLRPRHGRRGALRDRDILPPPRRRAPDRLPLGPGAPTPAAALRRPDGRAVRHLGRLRADARPPTAVGSLRALLRDGHGRRGLRPDLAARARGQPAGARRHRGRGREPRRVRRRRADPGPARRAPGRALDGRDAGGRADLPGGGVPG